MTETVRLPEGFRVVPFEEKHLPDAVGIEQRCFSEPWDEKMFRLMFFPPAPTAYALAVTAPDGRLAAFGGVQYVLDEAEVLNIASSPDFRRLGCARAIMTGLDGFFVSHGIRKVWLEVRQSNLPAHELYLGMGFRDADLRRRYYSSPTEDAIIMLKEF